MMSLIEQWISVQARVDHDAFDKVVDHGGDGIDASEALIERRFVRSWSMAFSSTGDF